MKQSFLIYLSQYEAIKDTLSSEDKGFLFDAICEYNFNDKLIELPISVKVAFNFMKSQFDRNSEKYDAICERNRNNGSKGGRPKKTEENPNNPLGFLGNPEKPKKPDNDSMINDNDNDNDISPNGDPKNHSDLSQTAAKIDKVDYSEILNLYHSKCKSFPKVQKLSDSRKRQIKSRINEIKKLYPDFYYMSIVSELFEKIENSDFMKQGKWANFDWIFKNGSNWLKIYEGNYDNKSKINGNNQKINTGASRQPSNSVEHANDRGFGFH